MRQSTELNPATLSWSAAVALVGEVVSAWAAARVWPALWSMVPGDIIVADADGVVVVPREESAWGLAGAGDRGEESGLHGRDCRRQP